MDPIELLKNPITFDSYYEYEDPFEGETIVFVFEKFDNFYDFITSEDNCLNDTQKVRCELLEWYMNGTCHFISIFNSERENHLFDSFYLKSKCIWCRCTYSCSWSSYRLQYVNSFISRPVYGNIKVRYTGRLDVWIEYRMICNTCCNQQTDGYFLLFEELEKTQEQIRILKKINCIHSIQLNLYSNPLGEGQLIKEILNIME